MEVSKEDVMRASKAQFIECIIKIFVLREQHLHTRNERCVHCNRRSPRLQCTSKTKNGTCRLPSLAVCRGAACLVLVVMATLRLPSWSVADSDTSLRPRARAPIARKHMQPPVARDMGLPRSQLDTYLTPLMTPAEVMTLHWYASHARTYVEFGSGASTIGAALMAGRSLSIDNHAPWCDAMRARLDIRFWMANKKLQYECVDTGQTGEAGIPADATDPSLKHRSMDYINGIERFNTSTVDVVLVDGRFRVACALKSLEFIDDTSVVLVHDFFDRQPTYDAVLQYYNVVDQADTLVVLSKKRHVDWARVHADIDHYPGDFR